ncbi:hypothetical protein CRYUN_Cryun06bG0145800 [Craigia yunnanensis]
MNVDASYKCASGSAGLGFVLRDEDAQVRMTAVTKVEGVISPFQAEIMALLFGLQVISEVHYNRLLVDIMDRFSAFAFCSFKHICRSVNDLAHNLAQIECDVGEHRMWRGFLPPFVCNPDLL